MSALDDIARLEHEIHDMTNVVDEATLKIQQADGEILHQSTRIKAARSKVALHTGNMTHMRMKANVVDIGEFSHTKQHLSHATDSLEEAQAVVDECEKRKARHLRIVDKATKKIERARLDLKKYGQLRQFPVKAAS